MVRSRRGGYEAGGPVTRAEDFPHLPPGPVPFCPNCDNTGHVCENHADKPWGDLSDAPTACHCGGAGMPCPTCCDPIPEDGRHSILEAFMPRHLK